MPIKGGRRLVRWRASAEINTDGVRILEKCMDVIGSAARLTISSPRQEVLFVVWRSLGR